MTLGQLDDVVITVARDDLVGDRVRIEDTDGDGEVEIVEAELFEEATASDAPGVPIGELEAVLSVVKTDEDNDC